MNRVVHELLAIQPTEGFSTAQRGPWIEPLTDEEWFEYALWSHEAKRHGWTVVSSRDAIVHSVTLVAWKANTTEATR